MFSFIPPECSYVLFKNYVNMNCLIKLTGNHVSVKFSYSYTIKKKQDVIDWNIKNYIKQELQQHTVQLSADNFNV